MDLAANLRRLGIRLRHGGIPWAWGALRDRVLPERPTFGPRAHAGILGRRGIEIGGPSRVFGSRGAVPAYAWAGCVDNVAFASETAWENGLRDGGPFVFHPEKPPGTQWIREATDLHGIPAATYEFVLSSHCLEHVANPLAALVEWRRVSKAGALLALIVPDPRRSFDHRRPVTPMAHLRDDFRACTAEDDLTHLPEILELHNRMRDPDAGTADQFRTRSEKNAVNRCLHHHVFDSGLLAAAMVETGWSVLALERIRPVHIIALAQNTAP